MSVARRSFPVRGMGCAACVARVQNTLKEQKGVIDARVSLASNSAQVDFDPAVVTPEGLKKAVQDAGYDLLVDGDDSEDGDPAEAEAERLRQANGAEPTVRQVADALGCSEAETAEALCASQPVLSLTADPDDGDTVLDIPVPSPEQHLQEHLALEQVLSLLSEHDRQLIHLRYAENRTQSDTAARLGMTQVQVSRREKKILLFLRAQLNA